MKILITILVLLTSLVTPGFAATDDFIADANITLSDVALGSGTTDMTVFASSSAESFSVTGGVFTVTNPGSSFAVGSANAGVGTIVILESGAMESCAVNSIPGTSSTTLPTDAGTYTVRPLEATSCASLCPSLTGAATLNAYPTCGAATCSSGYTLSGSGSGATCAVQIISGGGGGGSSIPPATVTSDSTNSTETSESHYVAADGTVVTSVTTTENSGGTPITSTLKTDILLANTPTTAQTLTLDASKTSEFDTVRLDLPAVVLSSLEEQSASGEINVTIQSREASAEQKTYEARSGNFLVGYDVFEVIFKTGSQEVTGFTNPVSLSFDISRTKYKNNDLKVYYYDETDKRWVIAGNGGSIDGNTLTVMVDHLTIFAILFAFLPTEAQAAETAVDPRTLEMEQIYAEANVVFKSGSDLSVILGHNGLVRDPAAQTAAMGKYTSVLLKGVSPVSTGESYALNNFIVYGTKKTKLLGAGERAGVVNSYKKAFGTLPLSEAEWKDCIAIANGRWPGETSAVAESRAKTEFKVVYLREAVMENSKDNAAVTVMAYGLRPGNRSLESEKAGIRNFKGIYKKNPLSALDWDIVRAISYSGAKR